jgi:hypothetical protein
MMLQTEHGSDSLLELLTLQVGLLDQLIEMGQAQMSAIENGRMSELLSLLSDKQPFLVDLADAAQRLRHLNASRTPTAVRSDCYYQRCRQLKEQAKQQFDTLFELEQNAESLLSKSRDQIARRLEESSHSMTAIPAYQRESAMHSQGGRLDLSSDG